ncbi:MAG: TlpA family protein disulfide reductase [Nitrospirae bacterium]|nr:MAG: TlpA family protein disulfide reductase [Nitrospirota bacterium]
MPAMARLRRLLPLLLVALVLAACRRQAPPEGGGTAGAPATLPALTLTDLSGHTLDLAALKGKVVIIDFWATWCPPCREAIPDLIDLKRRYGPKGLEVVGISLDENPDRVLPRFVRDFGINYPVVKGNEEIAGAFGGILGLPTTFVVDREGKVRSHFMGYVDKRRMEAAITGLL